MQARSKATRRAITDGALMLIDELGYRRTTVEAVADRARVSKGAVYYHFASKELLLQGVIASSRDEVVALIRRRELWRSSAIEALVDVWIATACGRRNERPLLVHHARAPERGASPGIGDELRAYATRVLRTSAAAGDLRTSADVDALADRFVGALLDTPTAAERGRPPNAVIESRLSRVVGELALAPDSEEYLRRYLVRRTRVRIPDQRWRITLVDEPVPAC
ncbi:TetR/AcrR family transcriptional regulator [Rhodococcus triatomae]|uniref:DNA-binding transcriptional regulator, AcrR family n=1 Tax=Rhodococcus triatomae TaxID=300028 RepID=A0A1G8RP82_9NOCA|nr:TetR/AcrR family transcriptional regulator [Rhodococcus triatomae]QNG19886.1 TetR/AcrR family transcriptional regulator [Rhodococcus triatomae]QNG24199.1 TetR/AcrR family transcriptional regulator [Rhodococcus triatomae]SDJ18798.1 DNA-binding transcriptional regulator, AcrR family [Rhodococcus triatomae]